MAAAVERPETDIAEVCVARLGDSVRRMDYLQGRYGVDRQPPGTHASPGEIASGNGFSFHRLGAAERR